MHRLKVWIRTMFGFSQSETNAFVILLPILFLIVFAEPVYQAWYTSGKPNFVDNSKSLDSLMATWEYKPLPDSTRSQAKMLFAFNPNTATTVDLESLGFSRQLSDRIDRYRSKGGHFRVKSDLKKIYGMEVTLYTALEPFIQLPVVITEQKKAIAARPSRPVISEDKLDLNLADTSALKSIKGIGRVLATRIIAYRTRLGGFSDREQLKEVWGIDSTVLLHLAERTFVDTLFVPRRLRINMLTEAELRVHPYVRPKTAKAIVAYRFQHGPFTSVDDLEKINLIDEKTFNRIKPYLTLE